MKLTVTGLPGAGKSAMLAKIALRCLQDDLDRYNKQYELFLKGKADEPKLRPTVLNMKLSQWVHDLYPNQIYYWTERTELIKWRDCNIFIDEEQIYFDAQEWQMMSPAEKRFFQQHRRYGVDIYGAAQDFAQVDKSIRRVTSDLIMLSKVVGTRDLSSTKDNPNYVLVWSSVRYLEPEIYDEQISKITGGKLSWPFIFGKKLTTVFNTREEIQPSEYPPLKKIRRVCPEDGHVVIKYV